MPILGWSRASIWLVVSLLGASGWQRACRPIFAAAPLEKRVLSLADRSGSPDLQSLHCCRHGTDGSRRGCSLRVAFSTAFLESKLHDRTFDDARDGGCCGNHRLPAPVCRHDVDRQQRDLSAARRRIARNPHRAGDRAGATSTHRRPIRSSCWKPNARRSSMTSKVT